MGIWVSFQSVHGFRLTELIYTIRYFCACRTTGLGSLRGPCYPHSPRSELFTTRSSGRPIRFLRIVTPHTGRGKTVHAVDAHELISSNCRFSHQMKVIPVVSDIWSQSFYSTEASFPFNPKIYRGHGTMSPRKLRSKPKVDFRKVPVPWYRKVAPVLECPFPAERSTLLAIVVEWKLVFV